MTHAPIRVTERALERCRRIVRGSGIRQLVLRLSGRPTLQVRVPGPGMTVIPIDGVAFFVRTADLSEQSVPRVLDWSPENGFALRPVASLPPVHDSVHGENASASAVSSPET